MNHLEGLTELRNQYFVMRHGRSVPNVLGQIVSQPPNALQLQYGLDAAGRRQVCIEGRRTTLSPHTVILSSDYPRARESAEIIRGNICAGAILLSKRLRERDFGDFELTEDSNYPVVWEADAQDPTHTEHGVESVMAVLGRTTGLVLDLESTYTDEDILLVGHGDTLQILQTGFQKTDPSEHRSLPHLQTAEIRRVELAA